MTNTETTEPEDFDALLVQRRRQAGLPEIRPAYDEAEDEEMWK